MSGPGAEPAPVLFEAMLVPHRSLSDRGRRWVIALICAMGMLTALRFSLIGAWPVVGFSVIEIGLAVLLLLVNTNRARASEMVLLTEDALRIIRTTPSGRRQERVLSPVWLNVRLQEIPGRVPKLLLVARGVREEVGMMLGEVERRAFAQALSEALYHAHNPRFSNPQLREDPIILP
jgi:uncharacterized membrane protein